MQTWYVTVLDRGVEITLEVEGATKAMAERAARDLHPGARIVNTELVRGQR